MSEMPSDPKGNELPDFQIAMADVARFVRQFSHDLRNHLNASELQSAYISDIAEVAELKDEVKRLRGMLSEMGNSLQRLTSSLAPVKLTEMPYEARSFIEDLQQKIGMRFPKTSEAIAWNLSLKNDVIEIDPQLLQEAILELFANAFLHQREAGPIEATAAIADGNFAFTLREPKRSFDLSTKQWGREPFGRVKHGHYGLGLPRVRSIIAAHGGCFEAHFDSADSTLVTIVNLPLSSATV